MRTSALRYYDGLGLLPPAARVSGRREYDAKALNTLKLIQAAQQAGFTLAETRSLLALLKGGPHSASSWRAVAGTKLAELDTTIAQLRSARNILAKAIDCTCGGEAEACMLVAGAAQSWRSIERRKPKSLKRVPALR